MNAHSRSRLRNVAVILMGGTLGLGFALWFSRRGDEAPAQVAVPEEDGEVELASPSPKFDPPPPVSVPSTTPRVAVPELASDGIPIMHARGDSTLLGPRHPHPITEQHRRIYRENGLLGALNSAVDAADPETLRQLSQRYRAEYPEDEPQLQSGYDLIADCLDKHDAETIARAQRYFDEERGSTLRRYVKRYCL